MLRYEQSWKLWGPGGKKPSYPHVCDCSSHPLQKNKTPRCCPAPRSEPQPQSLSTCLTSAPVRGQGWLRAGAGLGWAGLAEGQLQALGSEQAAGAGEGCTRLECRRDWGTADLQGNTANTASCTSRLGGNTHRHLQQAKMNKITTWKNKWTHTGLDDRFMPNAHNYNSNDYMQLKPKTYKLKKDTPVFT